MIFFCAFASLGGQIHGLLGAAGITPAAEFLRAVREQRGGWTGLSVPTLCWLNSSDGFLVGLCVAGCVVSAILSAGWAPGACALVLWALYLSLCAVGSPFLSFQWDALLLETALLAVFFLPWKVSPDWSRETPVQRIARWLLWWLLFRLMFASAVVKLSSGDETWRSLSALRFHFETQPLPLWTAWFVHQFPAWLLRAMEASMFAIEFVAPCLIIAPRQFRHAGAGALIALQVIILATGNYAFFNWLTIALCLLLIDDGWWPPRWRPCLTAEAEEPRNRRNRRMEEDEATPPPLSSISPLSWFQKLFDSPPSGAPQSVWPLRLFAPFAAVIFLVTTMAFTDAFRPSWRWPEPFVSLRTTLAPLMSFNGYGLFAVMTTTRPEIFVEGSDDGVN